MTKEYQVRRFAKAELEAFDMAQSAVDEVFGPQEIAAYEAHQQAEAALRDAQDESRKNPVLTEISRLLKSPAELQQVLETEGYDAFHARWHEASLPYDQAKEAEFKAASAMDDLRHKASYVAAEACFLAGERVGFRLAAAALFGLLAGKQTIKALPAYTNLAQVTAAFAEALTDDEAADSVVTALAGPADDEAYDGEAE